MPITELEHSAFCRTEDELPSKPLAEEMAVNVRWQQIPPEYLHFTADELDVRIGEARRKLGSKITILGHHYQREEVIKYADFQGDSYLLSREAASRPDADYIIFCGVHFMAETADILSAPHQKVILPNLMAGCSMADMARIDDDELCAPGLGFGDSRTISKPSDRGIMAPQHYAVGMLEIGDGHCDAKAVRKNHFLAVTT